MKNGDKRVKSKQEEPEEPQEPQVIDLVRPVLRRCAGKRTPALITVPEALRAHECEFKQTSTNHVTFVMSGPMEPNPLVGTVVTASFYFDGYSHAFVGHIVRYVPEGRLGPLLTVNVPTALSKVEARRMYRVPADEELPVTVTARFRGARITGDLIDIARHGLRFGTERMSPRAARGVDVEVLLQWEGPPVNVGGRIARVDDNECAIGLLDDAEVRDSGYLQILSRQERVALRRRKEAEEAKARAEAPPKPEPAG